MRYYNRTLPVDDIGLPQETSSQGGFWGRLWGRIKNNIGTIAGLLIGGPVGAILVYFIQAGVNVIFEREISIDETSVDEFPISPSEESHLNSFVETQLKPILVALANKIDIEINFVSRFLSRDSSNIITNVNSVLKDISIIKAYSITLLNFGTTQYSANFYKNKSKLIDVYFDALEKAVLKTVEDDTSLDVKLVVYTQNVSSISSVENFTFRWFGQTVNAPIKKYVNRNTTLPTDTTEVVVQNTDVLDSTPAIQNSEQIDIIEAAPKNNFFRNLFLGTVAVIIIRKI